MSISRYTKRALVGGIISLLVILLGTFLLGKLSGYEAKILIKNSISGLNTLCNTIALASATILALLLTLLSISSASSSKLKKDHYKEVMQLAKADTAVFIASVFAFLLFNLPITESDNVPCSWFTTIYYVSLSISSLLSAALIMVVLMLYNTVISIIRIVGLGETDHPLADAAAEVDPESK
jgi:MFS family permease